ncbi:hypothetical protein SS1G_00271 [Sclerotinia sclerotiorum 1980 UF-70]|uniref:Uncharacterized protein n=2 Tax=Sclerotinia sclerotiorum (strain ATCC 18683 / 1980 / Ss-1) TaxID=665079 RepID=A0A1D9PZJ2_SCLS1|nr:hypothetical protein SS1G_00271 [Sclerotinia sclerotiorum 1980 UF-70]APA08076.1 hypothetical protein sscle_03g028460 [Sclerotinia sclerotiorum 1980 UF-70]EDN90871.1 hypothetical protein SS1G_00271 [Sclerotinia sclerotiorum 1980 UF-70]
MALRMFKSASVAMSLMSLTNAAISISKTGTTVDVNGISYYVGVDAVTTIQSKPSKEDLIPLTVIKSLEGNFTAASFKSLVTNYTASDDVFNPGFLEAVHLVGSTNTTSLSSICYEHGTKIFTSDSNNQVPPGPYFLTPNSGELFKAYRLYSDVQDAFTEGTIENSDGTFSILSASIPGVQSSTIGVPSRLYYTKTAEKPLAGVRLGVKDIYDVAGIKTSNGNRAYYELYPPANVTGPAVQSLIDAGAIIVGKMKTSQFANGEGPTADWVDYHCPFNPRGDGYQSPSSSSSGPGAGIGAYDWLDLGIGSDTGGSIRNPSQVNGCFGNRPSHGLVSLDNVMPLSPTLDTAGLLTRDPVLWHEAAKVLYGNNMTSNFTEFPKKIWIADFPKNDTTEAGSILLDFLAKLETFLNATSTTTLDIGAFWNETTPSGANNSSIEDFLGLVYPTLIAQQQYSLLAEPFYEDYAAANNGARPFIDPVPLTRWGWGQNNISADATEQAIYNKTIFMDWVSEKLFLASPTSCSDSIILYPGTLGQTDYRNVYRSPPGIPSGWDLSRISNFAEVPDMVFPIGQAAYNSTVSLQTEYLPVAVDIIARKGCDGMIFQLAERLLEEGILMVPKAGSLMY